ncbi:hypothetical protein P7C73_g316, partial [Tremellales sp. Uapishka_1]
MWNPHESDPATNHGLLPPDARVPSRFPTITADPTSLSYADQLLLYPLPMPQNTIPRPLTREESERVDTLSRLQFFLATAPTKWVQGDVLSAEASIQTQNPYETAQLSLPEPPRPSSSLLFSKTLFEGSPAYKKRRVRSRHGTSPLATDVREGSTGGTPSEYDVESESKERYSVTGRRARYSTAGYASTPDPPLQTRPELKSNGNSEERLYSCPYDFCRRPFRRLEHLKRHVRTHTRERPFDCTKCSRSFSRQDNLIQHLRTHEKSELGRGERTFTEGLGEMDPALNELYHSRPSTLPPDFPSNSMSMSMSPMPVQPYPQPIHSHSHSHSHSRYRSATPSQLGYGYPSTIPSYVDYIPQQQHFQQAPPQMYLDESQIPQEYQRYASGGSSIGFGEPEYENNTSWNNETA